MFRRSIPAVALLAAALGITPAALAQPRWIDSAIAAHLRARASGRDASSVRNALGGDALGDFDRRAARAEDSRDGSDADSSTVAVVIELVDEQRLTYLDELEGVHLARAEGEPLAWHGFVSARIDAVGLEALSHSADVQRIWLAPRPGTLMLDHTTERIGVSAARGAGNPILTGEGILISTLDSAIDVFHPSLFHADAGYYDWIDANDNGVLDPGIDFIDLNANGVGDESELARILPATPLDLSNGEATDALRMGEFDPSIDWLFLDIDDDTQRDLAPADGWTEESPGFGEPIFVADDLDGDLRIDPEERLVRLGTSKIRSYFVGSFAMGMEPRVHRRGVDLTETQLDYTGGAFGYADTLHATAVAGILIGDVPLIGRRWVGVAPQAEMTVAFDLAAEDATTSLIWSLDQDPDVVVHEFGTWTGVALDGSDPFSLLIDSSTRLDDIMHVCAAGNLGGGSKHAMTSIPPGQARQFVFDSLRESQSIRVSVHSRTSLPVRLILSEPSGREHAFEPGALSTNGAIFTATTETERDWTIQSFLLFDAAGLPTGRWSLDILSESDAPTRVHAYVNDGFGFSSTIQWDLEYASDEHTISWPATADECLAVGAIPGHLNDEGPWYTGLGISVADQVRAYSSRGPRIDGVPQIGLVAPDNPWSPLGRGPSVPNGPTAPQGAYQVFSGTSGAAPHVGGVAALLRQRGLSASETKTALLLRDRVGGGPADPTTGFGPLDAAQSLGVANTGEPPIITLSSEPADGQRVRLIPEASDPDGDTLTIRWDDGYDGTWETPYGPVEPRVVPVAEGTTLHVKVRVRDARGRIAEAAILASTERAVSPSGIGIDLSGGGCSCEVATRTQPPFWLSLAALLGFMFRGTQRRR